MRQTNAAQASVLLALIAGSAVTEAKRERISIRNFGVRFKVDWRDDGRDEPYLISFTKRDVYSAYTFDALGRLTMLYVEEEEEERYSFDMALNTPSVESLSAPSSRKLLPSIEDLEPGEMEFDHHRRLYDCSDCESTWETMCGVGLANVCYWVGYEDPDEIFSDDVKASIVRTCKKFGFECDASSAEETCADLCTPEPEPLSTLGPTPAPLSTPPGPTPAPFSTPGPTPAPLSTPAPTPVPLSTPGPTPAPQETDACSSDPCLNGGSCSIDPAGGQVCSCASDYGGMACQIDTSSLDPFYIEVEFIGTWTAARQAVFQSAADKWSEVITHVPCGGSAQNPAGRLLISATLEYIDGQGAVLGSAGPTTVWNTCKTISITGAMRFDIDDIDGMESVGTFEGVILHEMGHVIGVGTLWGDGFGECTACTQINKDSTWTCPAAVSAYSEIGGSDADIVELDGGSGTSCGHLDEGIFDDEVMTGYVDTTMYLSKMTAAVLDDLNYTVDPSAVDPYILPSERGASARAGSSGSVIVSDIVVQATILLIDENGDVVEEKDGIAMQF